jgi:hypothetical protein
MSKLDQSKICTKQDCACQTHRISFGDDFEQVPAGSSSLEPGAGIYDFNAASFIGGNSKGGLIPPPLYIPQKQEKNLGRSVVKLDEGKTPMEHIPLYLLEDVAKVFAYGARKYAPTGWRQKGSKKDVGRYLGACLRHLRDFQKGHQIDPESGLPHLAHAVCSLLMGADLLAGNGHVDNTSDVVPVFDP